MVTNRAVFLTAVNRVREEVLDSLEIGGDQPTYFRVIGTELDSFIATHAAVGPFLLSRVSEYFRKKCFDRLPGRSAVVQFVSQVPHPILAVGLQSVEKQRSFVGRLLYRLLLLSPVAFNRSARDVASKPLRQNTCIARCSAERSSNRQCLTAARAALDDVCN
jgi:hypothetical protein